MGSSDNAERATRILDAAEKLIVRYGFDKTTVSDIAAEAGISKGAVYLHYRSKDDILHALILRESERTVVDMLARLEADPQSGTLFSLYHHGIMVSIQRPLLHALLTRNSRVLGDYTRRLNTTPIGAEGAIFQREMVEQLQAANVIRRDLDAAVISAVLAVIRSGFLSIHDTQAANDFPSLETVGQTVGLLLETALAPAGGADVEAGRAVMRQIMEQLGALVERFQSSNRV